MAVSQKNTTTKSNREKNSSAKSRSTPQKTSGRKRTRSTGANRSKNNEVQYYDEIIIIVVLVVSLILILSNFNLSGKAGAAVNRLFFGIFGFLAYLLPYLLFLGTAFYLSNRTNQVIKRKVISSIAIFIVLSAFLQLMSKPYLPAMTISDYFKESALLKKGGGLLGGIIVKLLCPMFDTWGTFLILAAVFFILLMFITEKFLFSSLSKKSGKTIHTIRQKHREYIEAREEAYDYEDNDMYEDKPVSRKKAKTFTFRKERNEQAADASDNVLDFQEEAKDLERRKTVKQKPKKGQSSDNYDMNEFLPSDLDQLTIHRGDSALSSDSGGEIFEEELRNKFQNSRDYDIKRLADEVMGDYTVLDQSNLQEDADITLEADAFAKGSAEDFARSHVAKSKDMKPSVQITSDPLREMSLNPVMESYEQSNYDDESFLQELPMEEPMAMRQKLSEETAASSSQLKTARASSTSKSKSMESNAPTDKDSGKVFPVDSADKRIPVPKLEPLPEYKFPPLDLLSRPKNDTKGMSDKELKETALKLQKTLESFGVRITITNVSCGPTVTRYELQPEQGVKVSKITNLADDIKLNLAAADIRIEAPIPGKAAVGIEVPNKENTAVMFRELLENKDFKNHPSNIAFAVGKDIGGQTIVTDIAKMPHLLIAGATGSGKSVCINTLIMSILYKADPADVKLIMVDPKVVELSVYNGIPHLLIPVVTDPKKASGALNWAVMEMTERYSKFAELGVRDIKGYNKKIKTVEEYKDERYQKMPQIVIIVDELADLMMVAPGEVEDAICRLAQMARAAGIHLIIATQRPSVNVITGLIKANVPSRIAFSVSSAIDSRTILDGAGAEKLLGKGDMLFFPSGYPKPVRLQGAFVSDKEVSAVVEFLAAQNLQPQYSEEIANKIVSAQTSEGSGSNGGSDRDDYFIEAGKFIIEKDKASIGMLQRVYKIGFNRAARIMDQLSEAGVVGPEEGTKPRKVLMSLEEFEQFVDEYV